MKSILLMSLLMASLAVNAQGYRGQIVDSKTGEPVQYASIGIENKNVGTVATDVGLYELKLDPKYDADTIKISGIGYADLRISVNQFKQIIDEEINMHPTDIELREVVVSPMETKDKTLGNEYKGEVLNAGFDTNRKGYEVGVLINIDKKTFLKELAFNMVKCSYSKLFYRVNIYKQTEDGSFENILREPIYLDYKVTELTPLIQIPIEEHNIIVDHNILVTLEHIKDMGEGWLTFSANKNIQKGAVCYYRTTSQGEWKKSPYKLGFSLAVKQEI